jgi:hypothetical protein
VKKHAIATCLILAATIGAARAQTLTDAAWTVSSHEQLPPTGFWSAELVFQSQTANAGGFDVAGYWDWVHLPLPPSAFGRLYFTGMMDNQGMLSLDDVAIAAHPVYGGPSGIGMASYSASVDATGSVITSGQWPASGSPYGTFVAVQESPGTAFCFGLSCPCGNHSIAGCLNSAATGALMYASGTASVTNDDMVLTVQSLPPSKNAILFMGGGQAPAMPFGDGLFCVSPGPASICRFPVQNSGATGVLTQGPGIVAYSQTLPPVRHIDPGDTWNFQAWYRDPGGPCGSSFNLSSGLSVTFTP